MRASIALVAFASVVACRQPPTILARATEPAPRDAGATPPPNAPPSTSSSVAAAAPKPPAPIAAWRDALAIDLLAADCGWKPAGAGPDDLDQDPGPLACAHDLYAQSCSANPCYDRDQMECKPACEKACTTTSASCRATCDECKRSCADDACRRSCATKTAACLEDALVVKDRCSSGTCGTLYATCWRKLRANWKAHESACQKGCQAHDECRFACDGGDPSVVVACRAKCMKTFVAVCPEQLAQMCAFNGRGPSDDD